MNGLSKSPEQASRPGRLELCEVTDVNTTEFTVSLMGVFTHKPHAEMPFASLYCHPDHGGGVYVMPEVGSYAYVFTSADGTSMLMGFVTNPQSVEGEVFDKNGTPSLIESSTGPDFSGFRLDMEPGDIAMATKDGNRVVLRRGGIVQIAATGIAQRLYIPVGNVIRDYFERYQARSPQGRIEWGHATILEEDDDTVAVLIEYDFKESIEDTSAAVEVRFGQLTFDVLDPEKAGRHHMFARNKQDDYELLATNIGVLSCTVMSRDEVPAVTYAVQVSREGDCFMMSKGHIQVETESMYLKLGQKGKVVFGASFIEAIAESNKLKAVVRELLLESTELIHMRAAEATMNLGAVRMQFEGGALTITPPGSGRVDFGGPGGYDVVINSHDLLRAIRDHEHYIEGAVPSTNAGIVRAKKSPTLGGITRATSTLLKTTR